MPEEADKVLRDYLAAISRQHGGVEGVLERLSDAAESAGGAGLADARGGPPSMLDLARRAHESMALGRELTADERLGTEAIIDEELRPAIDVVGGSFVVTHPLWASLDEPELRKRIEEVLPRVGRIELPGHAELPYGGTGFVVGDGLIMTNRHVAEVFAAGIGDKRLRFVSGAKAGIDFLREFDRPTGPTFMVNKVAMIHPYWDMALLQVDGLPGGATPLRLSLRDAREMKGHRILVVGYPAFDVRNPADVQNKLFNKRFGGKRLQPGELQGRVDTASFRKLVPAAGHDCSTLGGNSGSAVFDLETGEVLALHFGGLYHRVNYAVPTAELARDARVVDAGVKFAGSPADANHHWGDWWLRADTQEIGEPERGDGSRPVAARSAGPCVDLRSGEFTVEIPLRITVSLGMPGRPLSATAGAAEAGIDVTEGLKEPYRDTHYSTRRGYSDSFLGRADEFRVPMPEAKDPGVLASTASGETLLRYQNFSIAMHAKRRLALFTASNVTKEDSLRRPDEDASYSRTALSGLGKNDLEKWFSDPRLEGRYQLPDAFFTKDRKAFDKGHIVRRDDVAWGRTYDSLRKANGDTYHVTNCSPQVSGFNRSNLGEDNWGDLENVVLDAAASERLCVFSGPILKQADQVFIGTGEDGEALRVKIPSSYWKVIVSQVEDGIAAFGFVLEQDLSDVDWELVVPSNFVPAMKPLAVIADKAGVTFSQLVLGADQHDTVRGIEVVNRVRARLRRQG
jgi:endonuclease G